MDVRDGMGEDEIILFFGFFWEEVIGNAPFSKAADLFFFLLSALHASPSSSFGITGRAAASYLHSSLFERVSVQVPEKVFHPFGINS